MKLSTYNISSLIQKINTIDETLSTGACYDIVSELVTIGVDKAKAYNASAPKSGLEDNIIYPIEAKLMKDKVNGSVAMRGRNAIFDEFGTGEEGNADPHPLAGKLSFAVPPYSGYITGPYVSTHINPENGRHYWIYTPNASLPSYKEDGYTEGIPSGKQMYNTLQELRKVAKKVGIEKTNKSISEINKAINKFK